MIAVAILCGGLGSRLRPLTADRPKSLVEVCGKPFIFWQLDLLRKAGLGDIVLCIGHMGEMIRDAVGDRVRYSSDSNLGTGGAIRNALPILGNEFAVIYGDSYLECDYQVFIDTRRAASLPALITLYNHVPYGLGVFEARAFDGFPDKFDLNAVYERLALDGKLVGAEVKSRWYEIGSIQGLVETCEHLATHI
jgi:NDP-sugar pyrophosphorylase family protein